MAHDAPTPDPNPHSRACGWRAHPHGPECSTNCPTCHGLPIGLSGPTVTETPETPTPSLAERLVTEAGILSNLGYPGRVNETISLLAETAVQVLDMEAQLRQLDRIKASDVVAEVTQRVAEMRGIAKMIEADPHGIANEDDVWQWRRDAALLAAAYLDEPDALEADDGA